MLSVSIRGRLQPHQGNSLLQQGNNFHIPKTKLFEDVLEKEDVLGRCASFDIWVHCVLECQLLALQFVCQFTQVENGGQALLCQNQRVSSDHFLDSMLCSLMQKDSLPMG